MDLQEFLATEPTHDRDDLVDLRALDFVSSYDSHLMCPICHCPFVEPVRLQCDHVFCHKCLQSAITTFRSADSDEFPCPSCRTPTTRVSTSVPRLLVNMCDEIQVRCPLQAEGCAELLPRCHVQSHVDKYCGYRLVPCPDDSCEKKIRKRDLQSDERCLHGYFLCSRCEEDVMEKDFEEHDKELCSSLETTCVDCGTTLPQRELKKHVDACPDVVSPCAASKYGCQVKIRRADSGTHEQTCPLISLGPYFEAQNTRLNSLELTMRHLQQRNEIFEDGMSNIRNTLLESARAGRSNRRRSVTEPDRTQSQNEDDPTETPNVFSSNATTYLLSLHESLREEVSQMSHALTDLDARASMTIMNECLRIKEDMAHTNAAVNSVRMQVQWLMNPRLHNGARTGVIRTNTASTAEARSQLTSTSAPGPSSAAGPSLGPLRPRRPSDTGREGTKL
ncbi:Zinc finger RING-type [Penicillium atrosanguineum]|uniref:Zinc finger RING-type n=1 Tax=Penicillium atrosanguineum TaxID=1132637 RepID=A0A9W9KW25_9EURO|nr:Zinc finger RING-type [Penicillium atrosanguineum]KAJ5141880.1 Zinc finger RING-type [Penicillium atrosanguineum]KAJ5321257.1 Zinc finger RING-type [Penicillium atrosanguineum]